MKKLLSLILAISMCISLLPVTASAEAVQATNQVWNFKNKLHGEGVSLSSVALFKEHATIENFKGEEGLPWGFVDAFHTKGNAYTMQGYDGYSRIWLRVNKNTGDTSESNMYNIRYTPGLAPAEAVYQAVTFAIKVENSGEYIPVIELGKDISSPKWEVYLTSKSDFEALVPENEGITSNNLYHERVKALPADDRLFIVDAYDSDDTRAGYSSNETVTAEGGRTRKITAGVYYLTLISNEKDGLSYFVDSKSNSYATLFINSFKLKPVTEAEAKKYNYDISTNAIKSTSSKIDKDTGTVLGTSFGDANALPSDEINTTETDLYSIEVVYAENPSKSYINKNGLRSAMYGNYFLFSDEVANKPDAREPIVSFDLKNLTAGKYTLTISNSDCSENYGVHTKVYFGATPERISRTDYGNWRSTDGNGKFIGWHSSQDKNDVTFSVDVASNGNYTLLFAADEESKEKNPLFDGTGSSSPQYFHISGITLEEIVEQPEQSAEEIAYNEAKAAKEKAIKTPVTGAPDSAKVNVLTRSIDGNSDANTVAKVISVNVGESAVVSAPDKTAENYEFLYWETGIGTARRVMADTENYTFTPTAGGTYLTAVYRNTASSTIPVVFYNQTGDEISKLVVNEDAEIVFPETPSILGNNTFIGWKLAETGVVYASNDDVQATGKIMRFVALFEETPADTYDVTVTNNGIAGTGEYTFGTKVSVTAPKRENGSGENVFAYWTKTVNGRCEIVSFDNEYEFLVGEDCSLTAVYKFHNPKTSALRRILINENGTRLLAEFVGLDTADVAEKGILFNNSGTLIESFADVTHKATMKTDGNRLSVDNTDGFSYIGYAILANGTVIYDK